MAVCKATRGGALISGSEPEKDWVGKYRAGCILCFVPHLPETASAFAGSSRATALCCGGSWTPSKPQRGLSQPTATRNTAQQAGRTWQDGRHLVPSPADPKLLCGSLTAETPDKWRLSAVIGRKKSRSSFTSKLRQSLGQKINCKTASNCEL